MMIIIYNIALIISAVILSPVILTAFIARPKFRAGFWEKIGFYACDKKGQKTVVFHLVSVGEANASERLIKEYKLRHPAEHIIVTTTTKTGQELAKKLFINTADKVTYYPFDFFFSVLSFLNTFNPQKIIIAETEIWPCFMTASKMKGIKVYTVNGRISPNSFKGYKKIKLFLRPVLNMYEKIFMQSYDDLDRMVKIGAEKDKVEVMGNLKFDITQNLSGQEIQKYKDELKTDKYRLFIASSTHKGEDEKVLYAFDKLKKKCSDAKMLLAPRHPQRYKEAGILLDKSGYKWGKRSNNNNFDECDIILLDTMGELAKLFSVCHIAFIGGSFSKTGGHNPLEASIWNKPVISGDCIFNFKDVYKTVIQKHCAVIVSDEQELSGELISFYNDSEKYEEYCKNAKSVFDENRGAVNYVLKRI